MGPLGHRRMANPQQPSLPQPRASDPEASAWVNANAGSGKTHVLIDRLIRLMLVGTDPSRILCLTFTKAAAAEMSARLFKRLGEWIARPDGALAQEISQAGIARPEPEVLRRGGGLFTQGPVTPGGLQNLTDQALLQKPL